LNPSANSKNSNATVANSNAPAASSNTPVTENNTNSATINSNEGMPDVNSNKVGVNANDAGISSEQNQLKHFTPLRVTHEPEGSRIIITSDAPLNDYKAYRIGNRFYLVLPNSNKPRMPNNISGRGFDDAQMQKRGTDIILSFRLQPGTTARVDQKFNRLEIVFTLPIKAR
jgi:hypothetical protein